MATKRGHSPELIPNPFIKKRNLEWTIELPASATTAAPPASSSRHNSPEDQQPAGDEAQGSKNDNNNNNNNNNNRAGDGRDGQAGEGRPPAATVEAGEARVDDDHPDYFGRILTRAALSAPFPAAVPRLPVPRYRALYAASSGNPRGAHFVVHQHDHPVAGTHYDLRLQINETSSASWAIMYGLPGDPNSKRLNRNATETRVHCLWNHLIETASTATGSLLIWDAGTYTVLSPSASASASASASSSGPAADDPNSQEQPSSSANPEPEPELGLTEQQKLQRAFQERKIRVRLHGSRLPPAYALNLRLTRAEDAAGRARGSSSSRAPKRRPRRGAATATATATAAAKKKKKKGMVTSSSSDSGEDDGVVTEDGDGDGDGGKGLSAMEREIRELEDERVRRTNAYPGALNTIGSVHQRRWYLSLDREACGFTRHRRGGRVVWEPSGNGRGGLVDDSDGIEGDGSSGGRLTFPFYVRGVEVERSVVTGRLGADVLRDEGVVGYVSRKGWRAVLN